MGEAKSQDCIHRTFAAHRTVSGLMHPSKDRLHCSPDYSILNVVVADQDDVLAK